MRANLCTLEASGPAANPPPRRVSEGAKAVDTPQPNAAPPEDQELVSRARQGELGALDELIGRYQQRATSVAYRLLGDLHDALEVCQEAFIRAFKNLDSLKNPERFRPWLMKIVTNLSLNFRRSRAVGGRKISLEDCILNPEAPQEHLLRKSGRADEHPGAKLAAAEFADAIRIALTELTEQQRVALVLFSIEELPQKEVASIMGCSVEAVKWHVFQARRRLKERLSEFLVER